MVNIKAKILIFGTLFMILLMGLATAQQRLSITDIDVKVCDRNDDCKSDKNLKQGDKIDEELKPGGTIEFDIEVFNNYTKSEDIEIEDVELTITIEDIDDGDELDEEDDIGDIKEDDKESVTLEFDIPLEVDDGTFDVIIDVDGDGNGTNHVAQVNLTVKVEKERNEVIYTRLSLSPATVECARSSRVDVAVMNLGRDNEDDVELTVSNPNLGLDQRKLFDLDDDPFDSDSKYSSVFSFTVADDVKPGTYPVEIKTVYDDGGEELIETRDLVVNDCRVVEVEEEEEMEEEEEEEEVVLVQPPTTTPTVTQPPVQVIKEVAEPEGQFFNSTEGLIVLIGIFVLVVILVVAFIVWILRQ